MFDYLSNTYRGKTVLVTGHTGFKGSWLSIWLDMLGARLIGYSLDPASPIDNFVLSRIGEKIIDIRGDIRDIDKLHQVFDSCKPEVVFHLAAQPIVRRSYDEPRYTYEVNLMGTVNILECVKKCSETRATVVITSDKCYENKEWVWGYRENDPMGGYDPYSSSKGCSELIAASYRNSFFNADRFMEHQKAISTARAGNVIGGGDWSADRIIPDCIRHLEKSEEIVVRSPQSLRPWQHVLEPLGGYLLLCAKMLEDGQKYSGAWNFGPKLSSVVSVEEVVGRVVKHWGSGSWSHPQGLEGEPHEAKLLSLDISKASHLLNWHPRWSVEKGIEKTVDWYKKYRQEDVYDICLRQIKEYMG